MSREGQTFRPATLARGSRKSSSTSRARVGVVEQVHRRPRRLRYDIRTVQSEPPAGFSPIRPTRASSDVIAQIRRAIMNGQYRPGDRLPTEREMAQQFGVSRVTVRDALRALEANGLVRVKVGGQGGPYVAEPDIALPRDSIGTHLHVCGTTFEELAEARLALETPAAQLAAQRATPADLADLKAAIQGPMQPPTSDASGATSLDFHTALVI